MLEAPKKSDLINLLCVRYSTSEGTVYTRLRQLGFKEGRKNGKVYFDDMQIQTLDELNEHLAKDGGNITSFKEQKKEAQKKEENGLVVSALENAELSSPQSPPETDQPFIGGTVEQMQQIVAIAQQKAGATMLAERMLTAQYLANPELLSEELKNSIAEWDQKCVPQSVNAEDFAKHLIEEFT